MDFETIINLLLKSGIEIFVIGYFIFKDYTSTRQLTETLTKLHETTELIKDLIMKERN